MTDVFRPRRSVWRLLFDWFSRRGRLSAGERLAQRLFGDPDQAEKMAEHFIHTQIEPDYQAFLETQEFFFIATADRSGRCDCAFRGADPESQEAGYPALLIPDPETLLFPDFSGNGMYQSFGNLLVNPWIGMLFIRFETAQRMRVNGRAEIVDEPAAAQKLFGPQALRMVRVHVEEVFVNCSQRIPRLQAIEGVREGK